MNDAEFQAWFDKAYERVAARVTARCRTAAHKKRIRERKQ